MSGIFQKKPAAKYFLLGPSYWMKFSSSIVKRRRHNSRMDSELLLALCVLWSNSTLIMLAFICLWLLNEGECFHPHSVCVDKRHRLFSVVSSQTICQKDFAVKSISSFIAPRGSSSSKVFTALMVMLAVSGFMGCGRWHAVGDASLFQAIMGQCGFAGLLLVSAFEANVSHHQFYLEKLRVTCWLLSKIGADKDLPFPLDPNDAQLRSFVNRSRVVRHLFDLQSLEGNSTVHSASYKGITTLLDSLHAVGAIAFVFCVPLSIFLNDYAEQKVAWIVFVSFFAFTGISYLTGEYLPVIKLCRGWIIIWNPFIREPQFLLKLKEAVEEFKLKSSDEINTEVVQGSEGMVTSGNQTTPIETKPYSDVIDDEALAQSCLDSVFLKLARKRPKAYTRCVGHAIMITEGLALMTPIVAMGIQWITALCDEPPLLAIIGLINTMASCTLTYDGFSSSCYDHQTSMNKHCILKDKNM